MCRLFRVGLGLLSTTLALAAPLAQADEDWWFDVEVIVFDRNTALNQLQEAFELAEDVSPVAADVDVIGSVISPDISWIKQNLARCDGSDAPLWRPAPSVDEIVANYARWQQQQGRDAAGNEQTGTAASANRGTSSSPSPSVTFATDNTATEAFTSEQAFLLRDTDIAEYWVEFSGINDVKPVSVPRFRYCEDTSPWITYTDRGWKQHRPDNRLPAPDAIPIELNGHDWPRASHAHLLSSSSLELEKLSEQIRRQRGLTRLLHISWRQEVPFGQDNAPTVRLYAGQNYAQQFSLDGTAIAQEPEAAALEEKTPPNDAVRTLTEDAFFTELNARMAAPKSEPLSHLMQIKASKDVATSLKDEDPLANSDTPIWQLDGYMKVFLKYVNRVPYLHIDSEMYYRQPIPLTQQFSDNAPTQPDYKLVSVPFKQLRRVISKQLHYFDHPLFGMVVEIRRYERPTPVEDPSQQ